MKQPIISYDKAYLFKLPIWNDALYDKKDVSKIGSIREREMNLEI